MVDKTFKSNYYYHYGVPGAVWVDLFGYMTVVPYSIVCSAQHWLIFLVTGLWIQWTK